MEIRIFRQTDEEHVVFLWELCGLIVPWNDPRHDIRLKTDFQNSLFLVAEENGTVIGTVMAGYDGHRGWINYLAVHPDFRLHGIGRALMAEAENRLSLLGCPKINLQVRANNPGVIAFYEHLGFKVENVVNLGKRLSTD